jgi:hypothetical protein
VKAINFSHLQKINLTAVEAKLDFENYRGNELEVGHYQGRSLEGLSH